jgi:hypothetical protein
VGGEFFLDVREREAVVAPNGYIGQYRPDELVEIIGKTVIVVEK